MKVLSAAEMREVDRRTTGLGIPGLILMENAGHRVIEFLESAFAPLHGHRILVLCGKGNNGGDGFVVARQLFTRIRPRALWVLAACGADELRGDAAVNRRALEACGCPVARQIAPEMHAATLVLDAVLGTGLTGPPKGIAAEWIARINSEFPDARIVAVDIPSGLSSDDASSPGPVVRADYTVTFTAPKIGQVLPPNCDFVGKLIVSPIGSPPSLYNDDPAIRTHLLEPADFALVLSPRRPGGHKGDYGHVLAWAGGRGKSGAAAMCGLSALRAGAGLLTVGSTGAALEAIASHAAELMTVPVEDFASLRAAAESKDVVALGPGLGTAPESVAMVRRAIAEIALPMVVDADGLNALAGWDWDGLSLPALRVFTPHPGEMSRLAGVSTRDVNSSRVDLARRYARQRNVVLVLKGQRSLIATPGGDVWINPTGTPAMGTAGSGDILTGMLAGLLAQYPDDATAAVLAAVYLHGLCGELAAAKLGEKCVIAGDLLNHLGEAIHASRNLSNRH